VDGFLDVLLNGHWHYMGVGNGRGCELMCLPYVVSRIAVSPGLVICMVTGSFRLVALGEFSF
jgi:hypothetical protein